MSADYEDPFIRTLFSPRYVPVPRISQADERDLIDRAKEHDDDAFRALAMQYRPLLSGLVSQWTHTYHLDPPDARQAALIGLTTAIAAHDAERGPRLAGHLRGHVLDALHRETEAASGIPWYTQMCFTKLVAEYDGDVREAIEHCADYSLAPSSFLALYRATSATPVDFSDPVVLACASIYRDHEEPAPGDVDLCEIAFRAVDDNEERICRLRYGFTEPRPQAFGEIAERMSQTPARIRKAHQSALAKMRAAILTQDAPRTQEGDTNDAQ